MINRELPIPLIVKDVKTSGDNSSLGAGTFMIVDRNSSTDKGLNYPPTFNVPKTKSRFRIDVGTSKRLDSRSSVIHDKSTSFFALEDIDYVDFKLPEVTEQKFDEWIIGYNGGNDASTSLKFKGKDKSLVVVVEICGGSVPLSGGTTNSERLVFSQSFEEVVGHNSCNTIDPCDDIPCKEPVMALIEQMRRRQTSGGRKFEEIAKITPIFSCDQEVGTDEYVFWNLEICDLGDTAALGLVQSKVSTPVVRVDRRGSTSYYQTMAPSGSTPSNVVITPASIFANCDVCPSGYTAEAGGFIYTYTKVDTGASAPISNIPELVAGTNLFQGSDNGFSTYTFKTTRLLTNSEINVLMAATPTLIVDLISEVDTLCNPNNNVTISWTQGDTCEATTRQFTIDVPNDDCNEDRLSEIQAAYPGMTVTFDPNSSSTSYAVTLSGTSGTGNVTIDGVDYLATWGTDLATTASDFVTTHKTAIEALGGTVASSAAVITIVIPTNLGAVTFSNVTTNLAGAVVKGATTAQSKGCRNQYLITVPTNITCEECDPVFRDMYVAEAPRDFLSYSWQPYNTPAPNLNCLCGIRIKALPFEINPDSCLEGKVGFVETSVKLKVSAGYAQTMSNYMDLDLASIDFNEVHKEQTSYKADRDMLGGNLKSLEIASNAYFLGESVDTKPMKRAMLGTGTIIDDNKQQYALASIVVNEAKQTQSFSHRNVSEFIRYDYYVPVGKHTSLFAEIRKLAAEAGAPIGTPVA